MPVSDDPLNLLLERRRELHEQLTLMAGHVAAVRKSPFFNTRAGHSVTMRDSIEAVEGQIAEINRRIAPTEEDSPIDEAMANPG